MTWVFVVLICRWKPWSSLVEGDEQPVRPNSQTCTYGMTPCMFCIIFGVCHKHNRLPFWLIQPYSPSSKELHGENSKNGSKFWVYSSEKKNVAVLVPGLIKILYWKEKSLEKYFSSLLSEREFKIIFPYSDEILKWAHSDVYSRMQW